MEAAVRSMAEHTWDFPCGNAAAETGFSSSSIGQAHNMANKSKVWKGPLTLYFYYTLVHRNCPITVASIISGL